MARLVKERQGSHQSEVRFTRSDGELRYALVSVSLAVDAHERPLHLIWQVLDMTDRRRAAIESAARAQAETVAEALSKLQRVTEAALETSRSTRCSARSSSGSARTSAPTSRASCCATTEDALRLVVGAASGFASLGPAIAVHLTEALAAVLDEGRPMTLADFSEGSIRALGGRAAARGPGRAADGRRRARRCRSSSACARRAAGRRTRRAC